MANVYEALRKAEAERKRRATGQSDPSLSAVEWDASPETMRAETAAPKLPFWKRWLARDRVRTSDPGDLNKRRIAMLQPDSYVVEQFRTLRGRLDSLATQRPINTIAVASALQGEGKSTAAANLALVTAMSVGRRVLLVDCDLRLPKVHRSFGIEPKVGLAEVLMGEATVEEAVVPVEGMSLDLLAVRGQPTNPSELLASGAMREVMEEVSRRYDRVILDTPATLGLPDAKTVCELCDGLVLVVRADQTRQEDVQAALEVLDRRRVLGTVLNGVDSQRERYGYY
ncbi:MAG: CpsD/CapB family tyrosine-protein kinase [Proteobacteria bacterium]|nr:CpsD/CapB family tyrosine-protein kinase [Pseudomonadota bacterium]